MVAELVRCVFQQVVFEDVYKINRSAIGILGGFTEELLLATIQSSLISITRAATQSIFACGIEFEKFYVCALGG